MEAPTSEINTMLLVSLSNAINVLDLTVTKTTALVRGAEGEAHGESSHSKVEFR